jgi:hypothetical protein
LNFGAVSSIWHGTIKRGKETTVSLVDVARRIRTPNLLMDIKLVADKLDIMLEDDADDLRNHISQADQSKIRAALAELSARIDAVIAQMP